MRIICYGHTASLWHPLFSTSMVNKICPFVSLHELPSSPAWRCPKKSLSSACLGRARSDFPHLPVGVSLPSNRKWYMTRLEQCLWSIQSGEYCQKRESRRVIDSQCSSCRLQVLVIRCTGDNQLISEFGCSSSLQLFEYTRKTSGQERILVYL